MDFAEQPVWQHARRRIRSDRRGVLALLLRDVRRASRPESRTIAVRAAFQVAG